VSRSAAVVDKGVGVVDNLVEYEALVLCARGERMVRGLVARLQFRGLGDSVVVGAPHEPNCVTHGSVKGEGNVTKNTLAGCNNDGMCGTSTAVAHGGGGRRHI